MEDVVRMLGHLTTRGEDPGTDLSDPRTRGGSGGPDDSLRGGTTQIHGDPCPSEAVPVLPFVRLKGESITRVEGTTPPHPSLTVTYPLPGEPDRPEGPLISGPAEGTSVPVNRSEGDWATTGGLERGTGTSQPMRWTVTTVYYLLLRKVLLL